MKKIRKIMAVAVLGAMTSWSSLASADPIVMVDFEISGFDEGASVTGWFTGDDSIGIVDGLLAGYEVTAFELIWSGNSTTAAFTHGLGDLTSLLYNIGSNTLSLMSSSSGDGSSFTTEFFASVNGPAPTVCRFIFCSDADFQGQGNPTITTTTKVPEPGTLTLFGIGMLAAGFATRRRRV